MMRSLIDSDAIGTRRRRSRFRKPASLPLAVLTIIFEFLLIASLCNCYPVADDLDGQVASVDEFPGELSPPYPRPGPLQQSQQFRLNGDIGNDDDDDDDNEISRGLSLDSQPNQDRAAPSLAIGSDYGELGLARLLAAAGNQQQQQQRQANYGEVYLLEDKDYPKSLFEDYAREQVGQVSGITSLRGSGGEIAIFHRASRHWDESTFNATSKQVPRDKQDDLIKENTLMIIDRDGRALKSFGSQLFYMPHSVASDHLGNLWVSDVARHQVMRLPASSIRRMNTTSSGSSSISGDSATPEIRPDIILGEAFVPGTDAAHFCQPSEIAISSNGQLVYVADGYCNQRVMVFSGTSGKLVGSFGQQENIQVVHSLTLIEEKNLLCVADRENHRILCYNAGLQDNLARMGELIDQIEYPIGRVFAIASVSPDHLLVSSNQVGTNRYDLAILNPFKHELKLVWTSSDLLEPHSLTTTVDRQYAYAADLSKDAYKKVFKFHVIQRKN